MHRFAHRSPPRASLAGQMLVATTAAEGHPLSKGVILILEDTPEHILGVFVNSRENEAMQEWCRSLPALEEKQAVLEHVQQSLAAQQAAQEPPTVTLCLAHPVQSLAEAAAELGEQVRVFLGRVSWQAGALEAELARGLWMVVPALPHLVFGDHKNLWKTATQCAGELVLLASPGVRGTENYHWN